ncbi:aspartate kinase [Arsenicibacter rosenii]|uniref:Aspartokinase n=1 Tax=Arsenicibacter rosenii TaxID=1750698 RepID=A0A1S2VP66_9BACT|nr:aspartate kinase [Arsenicibacter rosenii]OIN60035.1 aspartate kinase [Arsenicibacter rosenii]
MKIFKFGGASVKDAAGVRNLAQILQAYQGQPLVVVVSAMGKTTNALEDVAAAYYQGNPAEAMTRWQTVRAYHKGIMRDLAGDDITQTFQIVLESFDKIKTYLLRPVEGSFDQVYDLIVSLGELISTQIIAAYLRKLKMPVKWTDARLLIRTDGTFREGKVDWEETEWLIQDYSKSIPPQTITITQGFMGRSADGNTTTLGREGSDYSAAIFAYCLNADDVTIWKDVPGVLNADPKWFDDTQLIPELTYQDAIELAYYGATVIHPKTIKPLQNKKIKLYVRSFLEPAAPGTVVGEFNNHLPVPSFIFKINQTLISLHPKDFSFIAEDNLSRIFSRFAEAGVKINLMQHTAISFSVAVDNHPEKIPALIDQLREDFRVSYNGGLELITIRYYNQETIDRVCVNKKVLLEQKSRYTVQLIVKDLG